MTSKTRSPYFNPRAPCGARPKCELVHTFPAEFQPTRPLRGATARDAVGLARGEISTHAPLAGRDARIFGRGFRHNTFQPTRPLRGATVLSKNDLRLHLISTHAPLAGRDFFRFCYLFKISNFNPRAPCGARPSNVLHIVAFTIFQPTRPLRGATHLKLLLTNQ